MSEAVERIAARYLRPVGLIRQELARAALSAGAAIATGRPDEAALGVEIGQRHPTGTISRSYLPAGALIEFLSDCDAGDLNAPVERLAQTPRRWAGFEFERPLVMAVVNVTPDSFSDGGEVVGSEAAVARALALLDAGADLVDVGGESTRPGADPVDPAIEQARVVPVIAALAARGAIVSIDTRHPSTMAAALDAGATIVNDVNALQAPGAIELVARSGAAAVLMHMQGEPKTMQAAPAYVDVVFDVFDFLEARVEASVAAGIDRRQLMVDTGIGFGKTAVQNVALIGAQMLFRTLGCGVLLGASRKGFIARLANECAPSDRLGGSVAAAVAGVAAGADIVRVHDVYETVQALRIARAIY